MRASLVPSLLVCAVVVATPVFAQGAPRCVKGPNPTPSPESPFPTVVSAGAIEFPSAMLRDNTYGACTSMFDLDRGGAPINVETRCNVSGMFIAHPEREQLSRDMFAKTVDKIVSCTRYEPERLSSAGTWRTNIRLVINFAINGRSGTSAPEEFARTAPAPPITPEQAAYFAEQRSKAAQAAAAAGATSSNPSRSN